jgi:uncharacterized protein (DUF924 family)
MRDTKHEIIHFWFNETEPQLWFQKSEAFDAEVKLRFAATHEMAKEGLCDTWMTDAEGCLALVIVLDQFPRHIFRDQPNSFAADHKALITAKYAISKGYDQILDPTKRGFLYLPFQHSEELREQNRSVELYGKMKDANPTGYQYAVRHQQVIEKFGRFPHRNYILDRDCTPEELEYLAGSRGGSDFMQKGFL